MLRRLVPRFHLATGTRRSLKQSTLLSKAFSSSANESKECWSCQHDNHCCAIFCDSCKTIQPLDTSSRCDYFDLFDMPKSFKLEVREMEQTYWGIQKRLHPDLYGSKSDYEKELSAKNSAIINDAYNILKAPMSRAKYLLDLHGIDALGESASTDVDPELLMETMEIRENIESASSLDQVSSIQQELSSRIDSLLQALTDVYDTQQDLDATQQRAVELKYMMKCLEEIDDKEEELEHKA